jgi:amino acid transporter
MLSVLLSTVLYVLVGLAVTRLAPWQELARSEAPLALAASRSMGRPAYHVLAFAALTTTLNACLVLMTVASRIVYGMAQEGRCPRRAGASTGAARPCSPSSWSRSRCGVLTWAAPPRSRA